MPGKKRYEGSEGKQLVQKNNAYDTGAVHTVRIGSAAWITTSTNRMEYAVHEQVDYGLA